MMNALKVLWPLRQSIPLPDPRKNMFVQADILVEVPQTIVKARPVATQKTFLSLDCHDAQHAHACSHVQSCVHVYIQRYTSFPVVMYLYAAVLRPHRLLASHISL